MRQRIRAILDWAVTQGCRTANPGALLLFHRSRAINVDAISAHETAELLTALSRTDEGWLASLTDRALATASGPARVHDAERAE